MDCAADVSCELGRIADSLQGFDWNGFVATLLATLLGATIAALVSLAVYSRERHERYLTSLDEAAVRTMTALHEYAQDYRRFSRELIEYLAALPNHPEQTSERPSDPERASLDIALDLLIVEARGDDRKVSEAIKQAVYELTFTTDHDWLATEYHTIRRVIAAWRSKRRTPAETLASLSVIDQRRTIKQGESDAELPPAPEPYERVTRG